MEIRFLRLAYAHFGLLGQTELKKSHLQGVLGFLEPFWSYLGASWGHLGGQKSKHTIEIRLLRLADLDFGAVRAKFAEKSI